MPKEKFMENIVHMYSVKLHRLATYIIHVCVYHILDKEVRCLNGTGSKL